MKTRIVLTAALAVVPLLFAAPAHAGGYVPLPPIRQFPPGTTMSAPLLAPAGEVPTDTVANDALDTVPGTDLLDTVAGQDLLAAP